MRSATWIACSERLPEIDAELSYHDSKESADVLAVRDGGYMVVAYIRRLDKGNEWTAPAWFDSERDERLAYAVTHWCELPAAPGKEVLP